MSTRRLHSHLVPKGATTDICLATTDVFLKYPLHRYIHVIPSKPTDIRPSYWLMSNTPPSPPPAPAPRRPPLYQKSSWGCFSLPEDLNTVPVQSIMCADIDSSTAEWMEAQLSPPASSAGAGVTVGAAKWGRLREGLQNVVHRMAREVLYNPSVPFNKNTIKNIDNSVVLVERMNKKPRYR